MSKERFLKTGLPCPCGKSSDAYSLRRDGSGYCFSGQCGGRNFPVNGREEREELEEDSTKYEFKPFPHRGISAKVLNKFNVQTKFKESLPVSTGFMYPSGGTKVRSFDKKEFYAKGTMSAPSLFLKNYFDKGGARAITIVEGEYDALAVAEMLGNETAVVSVRSSSSALADVKNDWEYVNSFDKIVINFDNDEPGQEAAKKVLSLFDFKKTYNLVLDKYKDANAYIWDNDRNEVRNEAEAYVKAWRGVKRHTPDNIISGNEALRKALKTQREAVIGSYPFAGLQSKLFGIHEGEVIVFKGDEGIGKTEVFRAIENELFKTQKYPIGIIHLEEDNGITLRGIANYYTDIPYNHPESSASDDEIMAVIEKINGKMEDRIFLRSSFDMEDEDAFVGGVRFLVSVCGAKVIFLDHITWLATGEDNQDERKKLDRISQRLKLLAKELKFALIEISHTNDDGKTRGSRNITKVANTVIHLTRDKINPNRAEANKINFLIEKARLPGAKEGPAGYGLYNDETLTLKDPDLLEISVP